MMFFHSAEEFEPTSMLSLDSCPRRLQIPSAITMKLVFQQQDRSANVVSLVARLQRQLQLPSPLRPKGYECFWRPRSARILKTWPIYALNPFLWIFCSCFNIRNLASANFCWKRPRFGRFDIRGCQ